MPPSKKKRGKAAARQPKPAAPAVINMRTCSAEELQGVGQQLVKAAHVGDAAAVAR
jgi:hypothetical protein